MYHDSDDEPLSGDEEERATTPMRVKRLTKKEQHNYADRVEQRRPTVPPANRHSAEKDRSGKVVEDKRAASRTGRGFNIRPVIVVDYDLTLVDRSSRPFPGAHEFIEKLREYNDGRNQLILYSHGSPAYIDDGLNKYFERERKYFDEIISDSSARDNKPITHVRRVIKDMDYLAGPYVIIDDMRSNLDGDQYDVVIDVTRMTNYGKDGRAASVDYHSCLCLVDQGIQAFLKTKKKSTR